jgi:uncharacterized protein DUF2779
MLFPMKKYPHKLSKSRFVSGVQCHKKLFFDLFRKELRPDISSKQQRLFDSGHQVGEIAQQVFLGGRDATPESFYDFTKSIDQTKTWINEGVNTIYEAAFYSDEVMAALDILYHKNGKRWAIEVKSSTGVKDYHYTDAALQYWVMTQAGYKPDHFILMHINNEYVKNGDIVPYKLFTQTDITARVVDMQDWVSDNLDELKKMIANGLEPDVNIGPHCSSPFDCNYSGYCWQHIPKNSVFELGNARGKDWELYKQGIVELKDIPDEVSLTVKQKLQVVGAKHGKSHIDKKAINDFLTTWQYPLYFFDFETIMPAIPVLDGTTPFEQVPFQYSLHIINEPGDEMEHKEFLASPTDFSNDSGEDPRMQLLRQMKNDIGAKGSIVAYNASFEKRVIKKLGELYPGEKEFVDNILVRFVDLLDVFKKGWYYLPAMGASASIKSVLPAIDPTFSYKNLEVSDGGDASATFYSMISGSFEGNNKKMRNSLLEYCKRDTEGMVVVWMELVKLISR